MFCAPTVAFDIYVFTFKKLLLWIRQDSLSQKKIKLYKAEGHGHPCVAYCTHTNTWDWEIDRCSSCRNMRRNRCLCGASWITMDYNLTPKIITNYVTCVASHRTHTRPSDQTESVCITHTHTHTVHLFALLICSFFNVRDRTASSLANPIIVQYGCSFWQQLP